MRELNPLEKSEFFVVVLPGLEDLALAEIAEWFPSFECSVEHGGVTVFAPLGEGLAMNLVLKTATRVLIRLARFRVKDFPKLYNKVQSFPWEKWVDPSCEISVSVATRLSRLKIKSRIEEAVEDGWYEHSKRLGVATKHGRKVSVYVRFLEDECTLSLDTSGERLHKRGMREWVGEAPLRETIAAALIQMVGRRAAEAGATKVEVVDPMMGSGTFLLEAAMRDEVISTRDFAFSSFQGGTPKTPKPAFKRPKVESLVGFEVDKKTIAAAKENLRGLDVTIHGENFMKSVALPAAGEGVQRWLFCNPPYGERLKVKEPLAELYAKLFAACEKVVRPDYACFILPTKAVKGKFALPVGWKVLEKRPFLNGGIPVTAFVFGRT